MLFGGVICAIATICAAQFTYSEDGDNPYDYKLTHTALQKVPAVLGQSVQLRCSKVTQFTTENGLDCSRTWDHSFVHECKYSWKRNGKVLNDTDSKDYEVKNLTTIGYCEILPGATNVIKEMGINTTVFMNDNNYYRRGRTLHYRQKCFTTVLTLHKVTKEDLGDYECAISGRWDRKDALNVTLFDAASGQQLPLSIFYFEKSVLEDKSQVMMQCAVQSGTVDWFITYNNSSILPIGKIEELDGWRCKNSLKTESHKVGHVTESFLYFENVCRFDNIMIYCGADDKGKLLSEGRPLNTKTGYRDIDFYHDYKDTEGREINAGIVLPTVVILFFAIAGGIACSRGKACRQCSQDFCPCCGELAPAPTRTPIVYSTATSTVHPVPMQGSDPPSSTALLNTAPSPPPAYVSP